MRAMQESTYNAIKAGLMIGEKKFNYELKIDGYSAGYTEPNAWVEQLLRGTEENGYYFGNARLGDLCSRVDGKILTVYVVNQDLMLSWAEAEEIIMSTEDSALTNEWSFLSGTDGEGFISGARLLKMKNGKILLIVSRDGVLAGDHFKVEVYISNNGLGTDFTFHSTMYDYVRLRNDNLGVSIGKPIQLPTGRIVFIADVVKNYSGYDWKSTRVFYSDNDGANWTNSEIYYSVSYGNVSAKSIAVFDDGTSRQLVYVMTSSSGTGRVWFYISNDDGVTWTSQGTRPNAFVGDGYFSQMGGGMDDPYVYFLYSGGGLVSNYYGFYWIFRRPTSSLLPTGMDAYSMGLWEGPLFPDGIGDMGRDTFQITDKGTLVLIGTGNAHATNAVLMHLSTREYLKSKFPASSISISKGRGGANTAGIQVDNTNGIFNPRNPESLLYGILKLNRKITIRQGYGSDLVESFTGIIDSIKMTTWPQNADLSLRDNLKIALDQTITKAGMNTIFYEKQPIENIVSDLCVCAGLEIGYIEPTGIEIEKEFSWQSYADAFQFLSDLASFEYLCDEYGKFHFRRDYQPNNMFVAWSFKEGEDIEDLSFEINDNDLYYAVKVYGKSGDTILLYEAPFLDAPEFNILPQKVLKIDATEATTAGELRKIAERAIASMRSRTRVIDFNTMAIPHLQIGDFIQLFESSTGSADVYRLMSMSLNMTEAGFTMNCKAYYYGDSVVPLELPTETATQTPAPTVNLIPEMTSNTEPSGVARASSVHVLYANDYKPWNAFNGSSTDLFWDASTNHGWIEYEFTENTIIDKYMLKARQDTTYNLAMPKAWTFEAFDGEKWIPLDARTGQSAWGVYEQREYTFTNTVAYPKYRLNVSANNGYKRLQLEQLAMYYRGGA